LQTLQSSPQSSPSDVGAARRSSLALGAALGLVAVLLTAALLLWANYGTAVFFETIAAGIAACF
jgi:hypothetical protein